MGIFLKGSAEAVQMQWNGEGMFQTKYLVRIWGKSVASMGGALQQESKAERKLQWVDMMFTMTLDHENVERWLCVQSPLCRSFWNFGIWQKKWSPFLAPQN